jgi:hypothetical protein
MQLSDIAKSPLWFAELFTTAKSFKANPIIGNQGLNRLGLHLLRVRAAHAMSRWRLAFMGHLISEDLKRQYREQGFLKIESVLPAGDFARLREEILAFNGDLRRMVQGDTYTFQGLLDQATVRDMPTCRRLLEDNHLLKAMMYGGYVYKHPMFFAHLIVNGATGAPASDPQKDFHADTFHPTMKAWLFLDDVTPENGPFHYVPGSHRLTPARRAWDHEMAVAGRNLENTYAQRGSFRISEADLEARGFADPVAFTVPANTLVMADTYGFHRRGNAAPGSSRLAIYGYSRANPFNPFPGALPRPRAAIEQWATRRGLATNRSWHKVPASELRNNANAIVPGTEAKAEPPDGTRSAA